MSPACRKCNVLVVGAGPAGLFLAGELKRQGVDCRLIDKNGGPCDNARATAVQPRSLEILEQVGLADAFLPQGVHIREMKTFADGDRLIAHVSLADLDSPFPFEVSLPQSRTERLLIEHLGRHGQAVDRNIELVSFEQDTHQVRAVLRSAGGAEETVEADYLVGCDGSHSTVRHQLGMHLEGTDYPDAYAVADVRIDPPLPPHEAALYHSPTLGIYLGPLPEGRYLFMCNLPDEQPLPAPGSQPTLEELQGYLDRVGSGNLRLHDPTWLSYFHCHSRQSPHYQVGRVFLAGDAAHVQSPAGGQGMNTGFQDGFNLAWKLALVLRGVAPPSLLDSYHAERHHIGQGMLQLSDQMHHKLFGYHPTRSSRVIQRIAALLAHCRLLHPRQYTPDETRVNYHHSPIVREHLPRQGGVEWQAAPRAGDRAPDGQLVSHPEGTPTRLFELIREPRHHLFLLEGQGTPEARPALHALADEIGNRYAGLVEARVILQSAPETDRPAWLDPGGAFHQRYGADRPCLYLVRPDGYVGYRSPTPDGEALRDYLDVLLIPR
jgi:2-polyprenyl-6-methoxyphenol hydroxylase-like FAD-dependent oxidoreductase